MAEDRTNTAIQYTPENEAVLWEFGLSDGCVNATDEDALRMAREIVLLRHVIRSLHEQGRIINGPMPWMRHSPADEGYDRALGRGSGSEKGGDRG